MTEGGNYTLFIIIILKRSLSKFLDVYITHILGAIVICRVGYFATILEPGSTLEVSV